MIRYGIEHLQQLVASTLADTASESEDSDATVGTEDEAVYVSDDDTDENDQVIATNVQVIMMFHFIRGVFIAPVVHSK